MNIRKSALKELALNELSPSGWLESQLHIQANGLTGNIDKFWPDIKDSGWFGGEAEGWERAPYWLDGALPLACLIGDKELISRIEKYLDYIIDNQQEEGWLGPSRMNSKLGKNTTKERYDIWPQFLILKVLTQYYDIKGESKTLQCIGRALHAIDRHIEQYPLFNWAQFRWFEALISILWYYEKTKEEWPIVLAVKLKSQGFDWEELFTHWPYKQPTPPKQWNYMSHVVNNAMAIKSSALWHRFSGKKEELRKIDSMISLLDTYHGTAVGTFSGDECLAGKNPLQGTELCAIVEYMFSLEQIIRNTGEIKYADRLEKICFNALPATFTDDMWNHQYDQQVNQIECSVSDKWPWVTNGPESNIFGLEPNFGCCTANMHQGWPKFARSLWYQDTDENFVVVSYAPCIIKKKIKNKCIRIAVEGEYPFEDRVKITIENNELCEFKIILRKPSWSVDMAVTLNEEKLEPVDNKFIAAVSKSNEIIAIKFNSEPLIEKRGKGFVSVNLGPLVFSLNIESRWHRINHRNRYGEYSHGDWELFPDSKWNYAVINEKMDVLRQKVGACPFSSKRPPIKIAIDAVEVENWEAKNGCIQIYPRKPKFGKKEGLCLIPYGCAKLRITEFPHKEERNQK